jgi:hypothetical protein
MLPASLDFFCFVFLSLVYPILPVYLEQDKDKQNKKNTEKLATWGTQDEDKQNKNNP